MSEWTYAQDKPTERLCRIEHYAVIKHQAGGDGQLVGVHGHSG